METTTIRGVERTMQAAARRVAGRGRPATPDAELRRRIARLLGDARRSGVATRSAVGPWALR